MSINTTSGNEVKFLGLSDKIRQDLLKAVLGASSSGQITVNAARKCYIGLSSTEPGGDGSNISEPADWNYRRLLLSKGNTSTGAFESDYLTLDGDTARNERKDSSGNRIPTDIKFNRSTKAWLAEGGESALEYKYFFLTSAESAPVSGVETGLLAWGELNTPITVEAKNVVPLFEEGKFRLFFPAPCAVERIVDTEAEADKT